MLSGMSLRFETVNVDQIKVYLRYEVPVRAFLWDTHLVCSTHLKLLRNGKWSSYTGSNLQWVRLQGARTYNENCFFCIFTDRIRSMGEGNVFTGVCHSVHKWGGGCILDAPPSRGCNPPSLVCTLEWMHPLPWLKIDGQQAVGTHPTAMHTCFTRC